MVKNIVIISSFPISALGIKLHIKKLMPDVNVICIAASSSELKRVLSSISVDVLICNLSCWHDFFFKKNTQLHIDSIFNSKRVSIFITDCTNRAAITLLIDTINCSVISLMEEVSIFERELLKAISDRETMSPEILDILNAPLIPDQNLYNTLSVSEKDVLSRILRGEKNAEIAEIYSCSIKNISTKKKSIMNRLDIKNNVQLFEFAAGLITKN